MKTKLTVLFVLVSLGACSKRHEPRSLDYFQTHAAERDEVYRKCIHGDGDVQYQPQEECFPASAARQMAERERDQRRFERN